MGMHLFEQFIFEVGEERRFLLLFHTLLLHHKMKTCPQFEGEGGENKVDPFVGPSSHVDETPFVEVLLGQVLHIDSLL